MSKKSNAVCPNCKQNPCACKTTRQPVGVPAAEFFRKCLMDLCTAVANMELRIALLEERIGKHEMEPHFNPSDPDRG